MQSGRRGDKRERHDWCRRLAESAIRYVGTAPPRHWNVNLGAPDVADLLQADVGVSCASITLSSLRTFKISSDIGHSRRRRSLAHVTSWKSRSSASSESDWRDCCSTPPWAYSPSSRFLPPLVRHTNSLTPSLAPSNRATGSAVLPFSTFSLPQILSAWSLRCGSVSTPSPKGKKRARQTGEEVWTWRSEVEGSFMFQDCAGSDPDSVTR